MAIGKVNTPQVARPTQKPVAPAKTKVAAEASKTAAAGWGAGKPTALKITGAKIDEGPKTTEAISLPKGFKAELKTLTQKDSDKVYDKPASLEQSVANLDVTGPGGKKFNIGGGAASLKESAADWRATVDDAKKSPKEEWGQYQWDNQSSISGAGTAGKMFSIGQGGSSYTGGAHPNNGFGISTFDARTGQQVKLDSLISPKQMNDLVNDLAARLPKLKADQDITGDSFNMGGDKASLRESINENFSLSTDKNGKVKIDIAWESGIHALGGQMAHFTVDAPTDQAFKTAIGAE